MTPPPVPPRIRTDASNPFAHHTMSVRVPAIVAGVVDKNPDYAPAIRDALLALRDGLAIGDPLPPLASSASGAEAWRAALAERTGHGWLSTDWLFAETYAYRKLVEHARFFETGRDPFLPTKREEYASAAHGEALERALELEGPLEERLHALLGLVLFGNRIDLSFAASLSRGMTTETEDFLTDERDAAVLACVRGTGPLHVIADNAGTELTLDLALADFALEHLGVAVVLHVKVHPTFVSDATTEDVLSFLGLGGDLRFEPRSAPAVAFVSRLRDAVRSGRLELAAHPFWNGPASLSELPEELARRFALARLTVLKGDANYRRAVNDAIWPPETPFHDVVAYFPAPLLALRTLKSDPIVGLPPGRARELDERDPTWRVNGKRGVASLGGRAPAR
ncbi:MAG TPA: damage-control phosphatase ARMT1 family protein [Polyangiaceae bacterium]